VLYAKALENTGELEAAENEFKAMKGRYSNFEQRYEYGLFLLRTDRPEDARQIFAQITEEAPHLSNMEKRASRTWINKSREELNNIPVS